MRTLFFVSHTHWDREWYEPFQLYRMRLVRCIDLLLDILASDAAYRHFMLDGQTIVLEDYVEVRPELRDTLAALVTAGRITVGPWYVLPDEFLVSGESLVRNLARGMRIARSFGRAMEIGYLPDPFGHVSQMPQILRGFGIETAAFRRGLADEPTELWWQAADGTRVLALYLRDGYDNAAWLARDEAGFSAGVAKLIESLAPYAVTSNLLMLNGTDHMEPWRDLTRLLQAARARLRDVEIVQASLPDYAEAVKSEIDHEAKPLAVARGELRNPKRHHLLPGVASSRIWIKQRNYRVQTMLEKWAEPYSAIAHFESKKDAEGLAPASERALIDTAWKYLLQNHPHDSICGCGVDETHADMKPRFDWAEQIAGKLAESNLARLAAAVDTHLVPGGRPIVVFNPVSGPRTDLVRLEIESEAVGDRMTVHDLEGRAVPSWATHSQREGSLGLAASSTTVEFVAADVPGHGYRTFYLTGGGPDSPVAPSSDSIENEFWRIEPASEDGTLIVTDKATGAVFHGLNHFVDGGDRGDLYNYCAPAHDLLVSKPTSSPKISAEKTPARQTLQIVLNYRLPASIPADRSRRSAALEDEPITVLVSVYPGVRRIDFETRVENRARDHRLRVEFPTPIVCDYCSADQAFDVVTRALNVPPDTHGWIEQPRPEAPMQSFVSISDGKVGLTLATRGLIEYEARRDPPGTTIALTLLRCVGWLSRGDLDNREGDAGPSLETPGGQQLGPHTFEYSLVPTVGGWRSALQETQAFAASMRTVLTDRHEGTLLPTSSFVAVTPAEFVVTAVKPSERDEGIVIRGFNSGDSEIELQIELWRRFAQAAQLNLAEEQKTPLELQDGRRVERRVRPREIVTFELQA